MTHTYAELEVSAAVFDEIRGRLLAAGYDPVFNEGRALNMHGIALVRVKVEKPIPPSGRILGEGKQP